MDRRLDTWLNGLAGGVGRVGSGARIQVEAAGICGSDVHVYEWSGGYDFMTPHMPVTMGHEFCGRVFAHGDDTTALRVGQRVAVYPVVPCGACINCRQGKRELCLKRQALGITLDGGFAKYVRAPAANCIPLPDTLEPALAALMEPLCIADHAAVIGEVKFGDNVLILGPGTIGQAVARAVSWRGANKVIAVGIDDAPRLETARQVGATHTIDLRDAPDLKQTVHDITGERGVDVVIEATGSPASVPAGLEVLRKGGVMVVAGIHARPAQIDLTALVRNRHQIRGAHSSVRASWDVVAARLAVDPESVRPMVSLSLPLSDAIHGFEQCLSKQASKVVLHP